MIVFRHAPKGRPFLWESDQQPAARWHGDGEGPVHYFADTPDGAWAEFLRHAEIEDEEELATIRRAIWAIEIGNKELPTPKLPHNVLTGGKQTYSACQSAARHLRQRGVSAIVVPSAALRPGGAQGWQIKNGLQPGPNKDGRVIVYFQKPPKAIGWLVGVSTVPSYITEIYRPINDFN